MSKRQKRTFKGFKENFFNSVMVILTAVFAAAAPIVNFATRTMFVFINKNTFIGFSEILLCVMVINAAFALILSCLRLAGKNIFGKKEIRILFIVSAALTALFTLLNTVYLAITPKDFYVYLYNIAKVLPYLIVIFAALFFIFIYPHIKKGRAFVAAGLITAIAVPIFIFGAGLFTLHFTAEPFVIDTGKGYRIVWATNLLSIGWVEYDYQGKSYKVYDSDWGKIASERIHAVDVPYEHLNANKYTAYSRRVIDELGYGGYLGTSVSSKTYSFRGGIKEDMVIWSLSDWHCDGGAAFDATRRMEKPDVVVLLGDFVNAMYREKDIIKFIASPAAKITGGEVPVIFARGNHEMRGKYARELGFSLGIDNFYGEVTRGDYRFIVLDTGEDKPDSHMEYGGMADFESYRKKQSEWLMGLNKGNEKYVIIIAHNPNLSIDEKQAEEWKHQLKSLGSDFMLSGHLHKSEIRDGEILTVIDGGKTVKTINGKKRNVYIAAEIRVEGESITVTAYDNLGNTHLKETRGIG